MIFSFNGAINTEIDLDPDEYLGLEPPEITEEIFAVLSEIDPDADYFDEDVVFAAEVIAEANAATAG